jgi:hypothetical protein
MRAWVAADIVKMRSALEAGQLSRSTGIRSRAPMTRW